MRHCGIEQKVSFAPVCRPLIIPEEKRRQERQQEQNAAAVQREITNQISFHHQSYSERAATRPVATRAKRTIWMRQTT